ncbi:YARHG domain-containing protein [Flavivirga algicola]|uniref:YARHG domain-containing protein n=1 Tax=Flavivirga algicola TaxID=2729136 RepID=A0ABX1RZJ7_9FLAO|nr:YARHG domain-containing protein [Flavivirga algicola]NMH87619.1 YARHG domain-containing protein [Flavivirga algicola]
MKLLKELQPFLRKIQLQIDKKLLFLFVISLHFIAFANDGAYYASGNQLIPITETQISISKEVLDVVRSGNYVYVTVDYTFYNPGPGKKILVGFEAPSPSGDVDGFPKNGAHPYISNFNVKMNGKLLKFETSIVNTENYYVNNKIDAKTEEEVIDNDFNTNEPDFYYVYHFDANFKSGKNKIIHTYRFEISNSILSDYSFDYILTAANRWKNNQIDDFTLNINMGSDEGFNLKNTFFKNKNEWYIQNGRSLFSGGDFTKFITHTGSISFKRKNFRPNGELYLYSTSGLMKDSYKSFDYSTHNLPNLISIEKKTSTNSVDENSFKVLRNLPFAIRGYVFKTKFIQDYYLSQSWYKPNPKYIANLETLSIDEKKWLKIVKSTKWSK